MGVVACVVGYDSCKLRVTGERTTGEVVEMTGAFLNTSLRVNGRSP